MAYKEKVTRQQKTTDAVEVKLFAEPPGGATYMYLELKIRLKESQIFVQRFLLDAYVGLIPRELIFPPTMQRV